MLSLFPGLLFLSPFGAFLIRIALAGIFGYSAWGRLRDTSSLLKVFGIVDGLLAVGLFLGIYSQLAALLGAICAAAWLLKSDWNPYPRSTAALTLIMTISLILTGAGPFAFDLPL